ncbi:hypothetical protein BC828DRAFT_403113 [Blastocladiella britannica]|nr:hypothetical protein BC828DRAFT_403113 [Blastocladiella britannica]
MDEDDQQLRRPSLTTLLAAAIGVPVAVYFYKCAMLVLFQNEILYMRRLPPGARRTLDPAEPFGLRADPVILPRLPAVRRNDIVNGGNRFPGLSDARPQLHGLWITSIPPLSPPNAHTETAATTTTIVYLQGNGGNIAHRHAKFARVLGSLRQSGIEDMAIMAAGYRGYGLSHGRPSEPGLVMDTVRFLEEANRQQPPPPPPPASHQRPRLVLYGHSLGGAVALCTVANQLRIPLDTSSNPTTPPVLPQLVVLENTFTSTRAMLQHMYPRASPFHHLHPFLRSRWDALAAAEEIARARARGDPRVPHFALISGRGDEIVLPQMMDELCHALKGGGSMGGIDWFPIEGALHNSTWETAGWAAAWRFSVILASVITGERIYMVYILRRMPVKMVTTLLALAVVGSLASVAAVAFSGPFIYLNGLTCNFTGYISWVGILNFCILGVSATYLIGGSCACYWRLAHIASFKAKMELRKSLAPSTFGGPGGNEAATSAESATPISREARVQRSLAIRGALTSIVLCMTMVPLASVLVVWMRSGMTGPWQLELAINFSIPAAQLLDPLIVISMNSKFREAMRETVVPMPAAKVAAAAAAATVASSVLF